MARSDELLIELETGRERIAAILAQLEALPKNLSVVSPKMPPEGL
jgi:hypothetical protein